ncbi:MAG: hypothetical protein ABIH37_01610 [archaeon]
MKDTYDFEAKTKARERLRRFIERIHPRKRRSGLRVLTMLGHEENELEQIWDPLGVPRRNITNVEHNKKIAKEVQARHPEIDTVNSSLDEYLITVTNPFHVINYDTTSTFGVRERNVLRNIAAGQILGDKGIVATWFQGKREGGYTKEWFEKTFEQYQNIFSDTKEGVKDRSNLISRMISSIMMDGMSLFSHPLMNFDYFIEQFKSKRPDLVKEDGRISWNNEDGPSTIREILKELVRGKVNEKNVWNISELLFYQGIGSYLSAAQERLSYIGDNGTPMLVDINYFKQENFSEIAHINRIDSNGNAHLSLVSKSDRPKFKRSIKKFDRFIEARYKCLGETLSEREFLGSSAKPLLTKQRAITEFKQGLTNEQIQAKYRGWKNKPLPQWRAHYTMGTYGDVAQPSIEQDTIIVDSEDSDLETITKDEAIDLLSSGIPSREIFDAYPTSFTERQLSAYKAHLTMGTYENGGNKA